MKPRIRPRLSRRFVAAWFVLALIALPSRGAGETSAGGRASLKLLTIGNSYSNNATAFLARIAASNGRQVTVFRSNVSGAPMELHVKRLEAFEADPESAEGRPYRQPDPRTGEVRDFSLREALEADAWDLVTLQQASLLSCQPGSFQPWAAKLVTYIRRHAPSAKIAVVQTWAYREDHPLFADGQLTPDLMFEQVRNTCASLAAELGLRVIPVGTAFQQARRQPEWKLGPVDTSFDFRHPAPGTLPVETGGLHAGWIWQKNRKTGGTEFVLDASHANDAGRYLAALVLYQFAFDHVPADTTFVPPSLTGAQALSLRTVAASTFAEAPVLIAGRP
jgi:hypothetical protein